MLELHEQDELDEELAEEDTLDIEYEYFFARAFFGLYDEDDE